MGTSRDGVDGRRGRKTERKAPNFITSTTSARGADHIKNHLAPSGNTKNRNRRHRHVCHGTRALHTCKSQSFPRPEAYFPFAAVFDTRLEPTRTNFPFYPGELTRSFLPRPTKGVCTRKLAMKTPSFPHKILPVGEKIRPPSTSPDTHPGTVPTCDTTKKRITGEGMRGGSDPPP